MRDCGIYKFQRPSNRRCPSSHQADDGTLTHRGPDAEGYFVDDRAALGHRRLSIIDLASGKQPMGTPMERFRLYSTGKYTTFWKCGCELEGKGHRFARQSDTEVILMAYLEWGERCVEKLFGMFAFAVWDQEKNPAPRQGQGREKAALLFQRWSVFAFASELKALRAGDFDPGKIDPEALDCYFTFGYIPAPKTIYKKIKKLQPAHTMLVTGNGIRENRYWS